MRRKINTSNIVGKIIIVILLLAITAVLASAFIWKNTNSAPAFFNYSFYIMNGKGMEPYIPDKSVVVVKNGPLGEDALYKVALCNVVDGELTTVLRVYHVDQKDGKTVYLMKSDSSPDTQMINVTEDKIVGEAVQYSVFWGKAITFVTSKTGIILLVILPAILIVVIELLHILKKINNEDDEKDVTENADESDEDVKDNDMCEDEIVPQPAPVKVHVNENGEAEYDRQPSIADNEVLDKVLFTPEKQHQAKENKVQMPKPKKFEFKAQPEDIDKIKKPDEKPAENGKKDLKSLNPYMPPANKKAPVKKNSSNQTLEELMKMLDNESKKLK